MTTRTPGVVKSKYWLYHNLWHDKAPARCSVKIADTIIFGSSRTPQSNSVRWLFTAKTGNISKKRDENVNLQRIRNRFVKVALNDPKNARRNVCVVETVSGKSAVLDVESLSELVASSADGVWLEDIRSLRLYVHSKKLYRNEITMKANKIDPPLMKTRIIMENGSHVNSSVKSTNEKLNEITKKVIHYLEENTGTNIKRIALDYTIDANDRIWLVDVERVELDQQQAWEENEEEVKYSTRKEDIPDSEEMKNDEQGSNNSSQQQQSGLVSSSIVNSSSPKLNLTSSPSSGQCWGDFCHVATSDEQWRDAAPGVYSALNFLNLDPSLDSYRPLEEEVSDEGEDHLQGRVLYRDVIITRAENKFVSSQINNSEEESSSSASSEQPTIKEFLTDWQTMDAKLHNEFMKSHEDKARDRVPCCRACTAAYNQINTLRAEYFAAVRPKSEHHRLRSRQRSRHSLRSRGGVSSRGGMGLIGTEMDNSMTTSSSPTRPLTRNRPNTRQSGRPSTTTSSRGGRGEFIMGEFGDEWSDPSLSDALSLHDEGNVDSRSNNASSSTTKTTKSKSTIRKKKKTKGKKVVKLPPTLPPTVSVKDQMNKNDSMMIQQKTLPPTNMSTLTSPERDYLRRQQIKVDPSSTENKLGPATSLPSLPPLKLSVGDEDSQTTQIQLHAEITKLRSKLSQEMASKQELQQQFLTSVTESQKKSEEVANLKTEIENVKKHAADIDMDAEVKSRMGKMSKSLEKTQAQLKNELDVSESYVRKAKDLEIRLANSKQEWLRTLKAKEQESKIELMQLKEKMSRQFQEQIETLRREQNGIDSPSDSKVKLLVKDIESLQKQLKDGQERWSKVLAQKETQWRLDTLKSEEKTQQELMDKRDQVRDLEDKIQDLQGQICNVVKEHSVEKRRGEELSKRINGLVEERDNIKRDMSVLQQSIASGASMGGEGGNEGVQIHALKAKLEAQERQFVNETKFIKAQLESELQCRQDLTVSQQMLNDQHSAEKTKWKKMFEERTSEHRQEIHRLEEKFHNELLVPQAEIQRLEDKIQTLQTSLTEMLRDLKLSRKKENMAKQELSSLRMELESLRDASNEARKVKLEMEEMLSNQTKYNQELSTQKAELQASQRTLQHEKHFLQCQLDSEITHKVELEKAIQAAKEQVTKMELDHSSAMATFNEERLSQMKEKEDEISLLSERKIALEGEVVNLSKQFGDLKQLYQRNRDQLRMDQASLDAVRKSAARLEADLQFSKEELRREREAAMDSDDRHQRSLENLKKTITELEKSKKQMAADFEKKIANIAQEMGSSQNSLLEQQMEMESTSQKYHKNLAATQIVSVLDRALTKKRYRWFAMWQKIHMRAEADDRTATLLAAELQRARKTAKEAKQKACEEVRSELQESHREDLERSDTAHNEKIKALREKLDAAKKDALASAVEAHTAQRQELLDEIATQKNTLAEYQSKIADLEKKVASMEEISAQSEQDITKKAHADLELALAQAKLDYEKGLKEQADRYQQLAKQAANDAAIAKQEALHMASQSHAEKIEEIMTRLNREKMDAIKEINEQHSKDVIEAARKADERLQKIQSDITDAKNQEMDTKLSALQKEHELNLARLVTGKMDAINKLKEEQKETLQKQIAQAEEDRKKIIHEVRSEMIGLREAALRDAAEKHAQSLDDQRAKANEIKANALKYQTAKWQTTLKECMAEAMKDKTSMRDRMKQEHEIQLAKKEREHENEMKKIAEDSRLELESKLSEVAQNMEKQLEDARQEAEANKQAAIDGLVERFNKKQQEKIDELKEGFKLEKDMIAQEHEKLKSVFIERSKREHQKEIELVTARLTSEHEQSMDNVASETRRLIDNMKADHINERKRTIEQMQRQSRMQLDEEMAIEKKRFANELEETRQRARDSQLQALQELREESQRNLDEIQDAYEQEVAKRKVAEAQLEEAQEAMEDVEDRAFDNQTLADRLRRAGQVQSLFTILVALKQFSKGKRELDKADKTWEVEVERLEDERTRLVEQHREREEKLNDIINKHEATRAKMHDTLVNHKRAVLMEHKVQSTVLQSDLGKIIKLKESAQEEQKAVMNSLAQLEGSVKEVERQMRELGKVSAIQDGRVNVAHAKKKRRLDQEFEALLAKAADKKDHLQRCEGRLSELEDKHQEKEDEMKELERYVFLLLSFLRQHRI
eukprot:g928.t1